jgi:hypothetical protein
MSEPMVPTDGYGLPASQLSEWYAVMPEPPRPRNVVISAVILFIYAAFVGFGALLCFIAASETAPRLATAGQEGNAFGGFHIDDASLLLTLGRLDLGLVAVVIVAGVFALVRSRVPLYFGIAATTALSVYWLAQVQLASLLPWEAAYLIVPYVSLLLAVLPNAGPFYDYRKHRPREVAVADRPSWDFSSRRATRPAGGDDPA